MPKSHSFAGKAPAFRELVFLLGRTLSQVWDNGSSPATVYDQSDYTYDYAGNRLTRDVVTTTNNTRDQKYAYDGLHRLLNYDQGTLSGGTIASPAQEQDWGLDQLGNWAMFDEKSSGSYTLQQQRYHNAVDEIDGNGGNSITLQAGGTGSNWADPAHDAAGNMTTMPQPAAPTSTFTLKYDAWNRMVEVRDGAGNLVQTNEYDGLGRRIVRVDAVPSTDVTYEYYYNDQWQLLTEVKDGTTNAIYQWHPYYIDALNLRMRSQDMHWFTQDANFNVTAALDDSTASVVERYSYSPYGEVTFLDSSFVIRASSLIANTHLYTGRERDPETGLQLNRRRYYAAHLGRWTNRDPIGYEAGDANLYGYVGAHPTRFVDPYGLFDGPLPPPDSPLWPHNRPKPDPWPAFEDGIQKKCPECLECVKKIITKDGFRVRYKRFRNKCVQWTDQFVEFFSKQDEHLDCQKRKCYKIEKVYWDYPYVGIPGTDWHMGHAAVKVTLCDGTVFYHDGGWWGDQNGIFDDDDVPWYAWPFP